MNADPQGLMAMLAVVRDFMKHLPKERREAWQVVTLRLDAAIACGSVDDLSMAPQMAFRLERVEYRLS